MAKSSPGICVSPGIAAFSTTSLCFSPVSLEQRGPWGQTGAQGPSQHWQGVSGGSAGLCWQIKMCQGFCVLGRSGPALGPVAIKQSPCEEGTEGSGTAVGAAVALAKVPWQE